MGSSTPQQVSWMTGVVAQFHKAYPAHAKTKNGPDVTELGNADTPARAIDGAGPARIFWRILFPLVAPGLVATSVFSFIFAWNEYAFALTFLSPNTPAKFTLPIYVTYFMGQHSSDRRAIMAVATLYTIPPILFFLPVQRRMARGLVAGAVKG
jgi:N,N'-diacetylchitobiose transport system permease protein